MKEYTTRVDCKVNNNYNSALNKVEIHNHELTIYNHNIHRIETGAKINDIDSKFKIEIQLLQNIISIIDEQNAQLESQIGIYKSNILNDQDVNQTKDVKC